MDFLAFFVQLFSGYLPLVWWIESIVFSFISSSNDLGISNLTIPKLFPQLYKKFFARSL